jgi:lincosamide nucleotidyltransferase A/C/D/E
MTPARESASLWTRVTDRVNRLVWKLALPRRMRIVASELVFRNPPMALDRVAAALDAFAAAEVQVVIMGGWGVDALFGRELRVHRDLDLAVEPGDLDRATRALEGLGFEPWNSDDSPAPLGSVTFERTQSCRDRALRVVEFHATDLGALKVTGGLIGGHEVVCLTAEQQLEAQTGTQRMPGRSRRNRANLAALAALIAAKSG